MVRRSEKPVGEEGFDDGETDLCPSCALSWDTTAAVPVPGASGVTGWVAVVFIAGPFFGRSGGGQGGLFKTVSTE